MTERASQAQGGASLQKSMETQKSANPQKPALLFDLDGTLIDSAPGIFDCLLAVLAQYGVYPARDSLHSYLGPPLRTTFQDFLPPETVEEAVAKYRALYATKGVAGCELYSGVAQMLHALHAAGFVLCMATSKPQRFANVIMERFGLAQLFAYIGGASMDGRIDTKAEVIRDVLAQPQAQNRTAIMIGDRMHDLEGARLCNLPAIAVLYGYGSKEEFQAYRPAFVADTPQMLCAYCLEKY